MSDILQERLASVRVRQALVSSTNGLALSAIALILGFGLEMFIDYWFEIPRAFRAVLLVGNLVLLAYIVTRYIVNPLIYGLDDESLALAVEREFPELSSRLIASIQLSRPDSIPAGASKALVKAMITETEQVTDPLDFGRIVRMKRLIQDGAIASILFVLAIASLVYVGEASTPLIARAFLSGVPLPHKTAVEAINGDFAAAIGDNVPLQAKVTGLHPSTGTVTITYASGRTQVATLTRSTEDPNIYAATLQSVQEPFTYAFHIYDGYSESHHVDTFPRPAIVSVACTEIYPAYTGLPPEPHNTGDLSLLLGSRLQVDVIANKECRETPTADGLQSLIRVYTADAKTLSAPLTVSSRERTHLRGTILLPDNAIGFTVHIVDDKGLQSKDPVMYRIDMVEDRPPTIQIIQPDRKEVLTTVDATPKITFQAQDDYGVGAISLHWKVDGGGTGELKVADAPDLSKGSPSRVVRQSFTWPISSIQPAPNQPLEGTTIDYWLQVSDTRSPVPNVTQSEHYSARIVSRAEKQAELLQRIGELSTDLDDIRDRQQKVNQDTGAIGDTPPPAGQ